MNPELEPEPATFILDCDTEVEVVFIPLIHVEDDETEEEPEQA